MLVHLDGLTIQQLCGAEVKPTATFNLARISLVRAACPKELACMKENLATGMPIVAARNRKKVGYVAATEYLPSTVIVAGAARRRAMLENGLVRAYAWIESGAMEVREDDQIKCSQFMTKLGELISQRVTGINCTTSSSVSPLIYEIYPFENYAMYAYNGEKFKQQFQLNPVTRELQLANNPVKINAVCESAPRVDNGAHYAPAQSRAPEQTTNRGGLTSELMTQMIRDMTDINTAVEMYLNVVKHGGAIQPRFAPVTLINSKVATLLSAQGINIFEFCKWWSVAAEKDTATVGTGEQVHKSKFAYTPSSDPSSWKLPVFDKSHTRNALARVNQADIPKAARAGVLSKIHKAAKHHGVDVSKKPTSGQKDWVGIAASINTLLDVLEV